MTLLRILITFFVITSTSWFFWFLNKPEVRYRSYPAHYKLVNGYNGPGEIISVGSSRSQTSMSSDILSDRFACGLETEVPIAHDISRSMPGLGIQYVMLRDAFESRDKDEVEGYKYALVEYKETHRSFKYHPFMYQVSTFPDLYESHVTSNLDVNILRRFQLFLEAFFKKNVNTLGLLISPRPASLKAPEKKSKPSDLPNSNVDLTSSQLINSEGLKQYDNAQGKSWKSLPDRIWKIDSDYERRSLYYARKIKKLGDEYNTKIIFHSIPVYYQPAQSDFVRDQFKIGVGETLHTPNKEWLDNFYQSAPFGDGGHMNRKGSSDYISWLAKSVFPECEPAIEQAEANFLATGKTSAQRYLENFKSEKAIPEYVKIPNDLGFSALSEPQMSGKQKASLRPLPYPYTRYLTMASDVDSQRWRTGKLVHEYLHDELGLPFSDSIFVSHGAVIQTALDDMIMTVNTAAGDNIIDLIEWYDRGWFDTIHGWGNHNFFSTQTDIDVKLNNGSGAGKFEVKGESLITSTQILNPGDSIITPHVFSFVHSATSKSELYISLVGSNGELLWKSPEIVSSENQKKVGSYVLPESATKLLFSTIQQNKVFVELEATSKDANSTIKISNFSISSRNPITVKNDIALLEKYNLHFPIFTTHGGAYAGLFGIENIAAMGRKGEAAKIQRNVQGDNLKSDFYWMDQLDTYNLRYILPANRTAKNDDVRNIGNQTIHFTFRDEIRRYSFLRSIASAKNLAGSYGNVSYPNAIGYNLEKILENADSQINGYGAIFYTHWGLLQNDPNPKNINEHFNAETLAAFEKIQKLYYSAEESENRYWVAPLIDTLQYSRAHQAISKRSTYDPVQNRIDIYSTEDPILGTQFPNLKKPMTDLAYVTFIVNDAQTARIYLDDKEIHSLQRNPEELNGKESITIVNNEVYKPIFRKVPFDDQNGALTIDGCSYQILESQSFPVLSFSDFNTERCLLKWNPAKLDNRDATHLSFRIKSEDLVEINIGYTLETGESFVFMPKLSPSDPKGWRTVLIDLHQIAQEAFKRGETPKFGELGRGQIREFELALGASKNIDIKDIGFLRQNGLPKYSDKFVVGGRVQGESDILEGALVKAESPTGEILSEALVKDNIFMFENKVKNDTSLKFYLETLDGQVFVPDGNANYVIEKNTVDINFTLK